MSDTRIDLIISDFDGTIVDTFMANFRAYQEAFSFCNLILQEDVYRNIFGLNFNDFMNRLGIENAKREIIKRKKSEVYPNYFDLVKLNTALVDFIKKFNQSGGKTAIASTAKKQNLKAVLDYFCIGKNFDFILSGDDVSRGKPDPEIYLKVIEHFNINKEKVLIFEDSDVGCQTAINAGIQYIKISEAWYGN